jgi:hypothetical protein
MNFQLLILLVFIIVNGTRAEASELLIDILFNSNRLKEKLISFEIKKSDAELIESYVSLSLLSLSSKKKLNPIELTAKLKNSKSFDSDPIIKKELLNLSTIQSGEIKKEELITAINDFVYLGSRFGKNTIINYSECTNDSLDDYGLRFSVVKFKSSKAKKILDEYIPASPKDLKKFITFKMQKLKLGKLNKSNSAFILPFEEKSLALFLAMSEFGTNEQKEFIEAVSLLSKNKSRTQLIDPKYPHKFWKVLSSDLTDEDLKGWTSTIEDTTEKMKKGTFSIEEAFYKVLKEKAQNNPFLLKQLETLKSKRCFFK